MISLILGGDMFEDLYAAGFMGALEKLGLQGSPNVSKLPLSKMMRQKKEPTRPKSYMRTSGVKIKSPATPGLKRSVSFGNGQRSVAVGGSGTAHGFQNPG